MKKQVNLVLVLVLGLLMLSTSQLALAAGHHSDMSTMIRVAHLSPDAPAVDIWVDGEVALSDVPYKAVSDYLELPAGSHRIQVSPAGETEPIVIDATVDFKAGTAYTVAATGFLNEGDLAPIVVTDNQEPMSDKAMVKFIHTSPDAPAVDIAVSGCGGDILFRDVTFRESSKTIKVDPGMIDLEVRVAGTGNVALKLQDLQFESGTNYSIFAIGSANEGTLEALKVTDKSLAAEVRVAHLSPDAPAVDIWVDGEVALSDVPYKAVSDYLELPAGSHRIQVSPAGETEPIVIDATVDFKAGTAYTIAATGLLNEDDLAPIVLTDDRSTAMSDSKVRFVHTSPDAPAVDVAQSGGAVLFRDASFREASKYMSLPAGNYNLEVRVAGTMDVALPLPGVTLEEATNYTVFAVGTLKEETLEALIAVDAS